MTSSAYHTDSLTTTLVTDKEVSNPSMGGFTFFSENKDGVQIIRQTVGYFKKSNVRDFYNQF